MGRKFTTHSLLLATANPTTMPRSDCTPPRRICIGNYYSVNIQFKTDTNENECNQSPINSLVIIIVHLFARISGERHQHETSNYVNQMCATRCDVMR